MARKDPKADAFRRLTGDDLEAWAGDKIVTRGRSYQRTGHVQELGRTPGGSIVAWVAGTERYATVVDIDDDGLTSDCTCPYAYTCKHAVAAVIEYLERLKDEAEVPTVSDMDERLVLLKEGQWGIEGKGQAEGRGR